MATLFANENNADKSIIVIWVLEDDKIKIKRFKGYLDPKKYYAYRVFFSNFHSKINQ
jgi:hypothetical protein